MTLAEKIYKHMLLKGLSQQKLARLAAMSDSEVSRILHGKSSPSLSYAFRLAQVLEVSLDYLANDEIERESDPIDEQSPEGELVSLGHDIGIRQARRLLETAAELGYDLAIRRLLGMEHKPIIEVVTDGAPSRQNRANRA